MKKLLFSRSQKKHFSDTVVRIGKNNLGFSLVELIVIIAIMAVLVAIAIPVLGMFIEKARIANDKQVVSDILYAIDLANEANAFADNNSMMLGSTKYPFAFIVINKEGTKVMTSNTPINEVEGECNFQDVMVYYAKPQSATIVCGGSKLFGGTCTTNVTGNIYTIETQTINICITHSKKNSDPIKFAKTLKGDHGTIVSCKAVAATYTEEIEAGNFVTASLTDLSAQGLYQDSGNGKCTMAKHGTLGTPSVTVDDVNNSVYAAIANVYGNSFTTELKLSYGEWMTDGNFNYSTFYSSAPQVFEEVQSLGNVLVLACTLGDTAKEKLGLSKVYSSTAEIMDTFSETFYSAYPAYQLPNDDANAAKDWESIWLSIPNQSHTSYGFEISGRENYSACRMGYNTAFASYLDAMGCEYADEVKNYYSNSINLVVTQVELPGLVTISAFQDGTNWDERKNIATQVPSEKSTLGYQLGSVDAINEVYGYYMDYIKSDAFIENGKTFYSTIVTVNDTSDTANVHADGNSQKYFEFYGAYLKEMANLYNKAQEIAGSDGVMIIVYVENGMAICEVSPSAADPRND